MARGIVALIAVLYGGAWVMEQIPNQHWTGAPTIGLIMLLFIGCIAWTIRCIEKGKKI